MGSDVLDRVTVELAAMTRHALGAGLPVDAGVVTLLRNDAPPAAGDVAPLLDAHRRMAALVAPATPAGLALLHAERDTAGRWSFLGPVRLVRHLLAAALGFLAVFVATSMSGYVGHDTGDIFDASGLAVLVPELFLLAAAGMGAAFGALFRAQRYVASGRYDPVYEASYWVHVVLGVMAGILLAELIPVESGEANRPLLALLGGFSSSVVHRVLVRLVDVLESLFAPPDYPNRRAPAPPDTTQGVPHA